MPKTLENIKRYTEFMDVKSAYRFILNELISESLNVPAEGYHSMDVKDNPEYETKELIGFYYVVRRPTVQQCEDLIQLTGVNLEWARAESESRMEENPQNPGTAYLKNEAFWKKMLEADGKFSYTYGLRLRNYGSDDNVPNIHRGLESGNLGTDQISKIIEEIKLHGNTRQAIISVWDGDIDLERMGKRRVPCSICYQFIAREGQLNVIYNSRSSDAFSLLPSDVFQCVKLQSYIAEQTNLEIGIMHHIIGSLHIYQKNLEKAKSVLEKLPTPSQNESTSTK